MPQSVSVAMLSVLIEFGLTHVSAVRLHFNWNPSSNDCWFLVCIAVSIQSSAWTVFAHHENEIGYNLLVFMEWGYTAYSCIAESKWRIFAAHCAYRICILSHSHLASLCVIQPFEAPTSGLTRTILTHRCRLDWNRCILIQSTQRVLR